MSEEDAAVEAAEEDGRDFVTQEDVEQAEQHLKDLNGCQKNLIPRRFSKSYKELNQSLVRKKKTFVISL